MIPDIVFDGSMATNRVCQIDSIKIKVSNAFLKRILKELQMHIK